MFEVIETPRPNLSPNAPRIVQIKIPVDRIGKVIGPGGKMIRAIQEETGVRIDIEDDGTVNIAAVGDDKINAARKRIEDLTMVAEIGKIYDGVVVSLRDFGAFVRIGGDLEGLCHVSELTDGYIRDIYSFVRPGDAFRVKVISIEDDKVRLSRKQALADNRPPRPADPRRNDRNGRDNRGDRGGRDRGRDRH
jgi:polyribonucleotide nucleotidyltransferase